MGAESFRDGLQGASVTRGLVVAHASKTDSSGQVPASPHKAPRFSESSLPSVAGGFPQARAQTRFLAVWAAFAAPASVTTTLSGALGQARLRALLAAASSCVKLPSGSE